MEITPQIRTLDAPDALDTLESLAVGAVAATTLALAHARVELTFAQWRVLMVVAEGPDGATVGEIAASLGAAISPASRLVARMRARGLVLTQKDAHDHRATRVHLSELGWAVRGRVLAGRRDQLRAALERVPPLTPAAVGELDQVARALRRTP
ncbi:MAG: MarR family winged helix-turn-helix transcriptional regulator [Candidatus Limnocylindrales bacterium]